MSGELVRILLIFGPIGLLLAVGFCVTLWSGVYSIASFDGLRKAGENFTRTVVLVGGSLVAMAALQQFVGFRMMPIW